MSVAEEAIRFATVRLLASDQNDRPVVCGSGFLIAQDLVLSCAHVVQACLSFTEAEAAATLPHTMPAESVRLDSPFWRDHPPLLAKIRHLDPSPQCDLAVLELITSPPAEARPLPLKLVGDFWNHRYLVLGYSDREGRGIWASGKFQGTDSAGFIQMASDPGSENIIQQGFSGAPVWDETEQAVVGMVQSMIFWHLPVASRPLMLPLQHLCQSWPELKRYLVPPAAPPAVSARAPADPFAGEVWHPGQLVEIAERQYLLKESLHEERTADPPALERWYLARPFTRAQTRRRAGIDYVLIKQMVLPVLLSYGSDLLQPLKKESQLLQRLPQGTIFPELVTTVTGAQSFTLVQRYPPGKTLSQWFPAQFGPEKRPVDRQRLRLLLRTLPAFCRGLARLHELGYAHRCLSGTSLLLQAPRQGTPVLRLRDLGLATRPFRAGEGPEGYAAPEQRDRRYTRPSSDIYQLGALLYHLLTGESVKSFLYTLPPPSSLNPSLPPDLDKVILRALEPEPDDRWPDLRAFAAALGDVQRGWRNA
jgi:hypothetical protein